VESAQAFFREAVKVQGDSWPRKINLDGNAASQLGLRLLREEDPRWRPFEVRARRYLNNVVEQDHRAIKRRCAPMLGLKSFRTAAITLAGVELAHRVRKRQFALLCDEHGKDSSLKEIWDQALNRDCEPVTQVGEFLPSMHQISIRTSRPPTVRLPGAPVRYPRKVSYGHGLCLLLMPKGGQYWRYIYRYDKKRKSLALGTCPVVPVEVARARHQVARELLAVGVDPATRRKELRRVTLGYLVAA
jgi:hypothetical protein